jgi:hypothetical protein
MEENPWSPDFWTLRHNISRRNKVFPKNADNGLKRAV